MKPNILWVGILILLPLVAWPAERVALRSAGEDVAVTVVQSSATETVLRFEVNAYEREAVEIAGQQYYLVTCGREGILLNAGEPSLPRICRSIIVPDEAEMAVEVVASGYQDFPATPVAPSKGNLLRTVDPASVPYAFGDIYQNDQPYPVELAALREPYVLRDYRGTVVELNAFQYLPREQTLRVYTSVTVAIRSVGYSSVNSIQRSAPPSKVDPAFDQIYRHHFLNYGGDDPLLYTPVLEDGEMLIVTYDSFHATMQPFVSWKIQKGIKTTVVDVSTIGSNSTAIRNYIQTFYNNSQGNLAYVLLVGDAAQIPTPSASGGSSDPTYAKVVGGDNYPDIFVGRFSAENTAQVQTQVARSVAYERDAQDGMAWYHQGTGIGSDQGPGDDGEMDFQHENNIRADLLGYNYTLVDQIYDPGATAAQVTAALNAGRSVVNYTGHGSTQAWTTTGFSNTQIAALTNDNKLPFIWSVACVNGQFSGYTCFAEAWLRATHNGNPIGAIGTYMSSINQTWNPPMDAQDEFVDLLCAESKTTFGGLSYNGSCHMIDVYGSGGVDMYNTWHIFGDPSLQVRTETPAAMTVTHEGNVDPAAESYSLNVAAVVGALCALSRDDTLYGAAYTNATGDAAIPIMQPLPVGENLVLTVTAMNRFAFIDSVAVGGGFSDPDSLVILPVQSDIYLWWTPANGAVFYDVFRGTTEDFLLDGVLIGTSDTAGYIDVGAVNLPDSQYFYTVIAEYGAALGTRLPLGTPYSALHR